MDCQGVVVFEVGLRKNTNMDPSSALATRPLPSQQMRVMRERRAIDTLHT
jgi:hypothetical protein